MKHTKLLLTAYLVVLLWLVLFKLSFDFSGTLALHTRGFNLTPFAAYSRANIWEMLENIIVFIPFGVLLGVNLKNTSFRKKLAVIILFSAAVEVIQYVLAIGVMDITDVITNGLGGLAGLLLYALGGKYVKREKLDKAIIAALSLLLLSFLVIRIFVLKVNYKPLRDVRIDRSTGQRLAPSLR